MVEARGLLDHDSPPPDAFKSSGCSPSHDDRGAQIALFGYPQIICRCRYAVTGDVARYRVSGVFLGHLGHLGLDVLMQHSSIANSR